MITPAEWFVRKAVRVTKDQERPGFTIYAGAEGEMAGVLGAETASIWFGNLGRSINVPFADLEWVVP
jgi:hypothetical protein